MGKKRLLYQAEEGADKRGLLSSLMLRHCEADEGALYGWGIKSWGDAQRQPAEPGKVALLREDVADPATNRSIATASSKSAHCPKKAKAASLPIRRNDVRAD